MLREVGRRLQAVSAPHLPLRLSGDEFALLLPETTHRDAESAVGRIVSRLTETMAARGWPITFSVGAATFHATRRSLDEMVGVADALMYEVKTTGKAGVKYRDIGRDGAPSIG